MKYFLLILSVLFTLMINADECTVEITAVKANCDGNGSSCYNYFFDNQTDKDFMACIWDDKTKGGYVFCTFADRKYKESFKDVLVGLVKPDQVKTFKTACLPESDADKLYD